MGKLKIKKKHRRKAIKSGQWLWKNGGQHAVLALMTRGAVR